MKKKALISSILTIALCLSLVAGSTFALFTASTDFNIAVTAGKVDIEASASISAVYSAEGVGDGETAEDRFLIDENDNEYKHVASLDNKTFANGGVAELDGASLKIQRLTPGDKVDIQINVANNSNVAISYRYKIAINPNSTLDNELATGMVVSVLDKLTFAKESYEGFESYTSEWYYVEAPDGNPVAIEPRTISVELPVYAGNEYQEKSVEYIVTVEAVQGNAVTTNDSIVTILPEAFQKMMNERGEINANGSTINLEECLTLTGNTTILNAVIKGENADAGDAVVPLLVVGGDLTLGAGTTVTTGDYGVFVMGGDKLTLDAGSKLVVNDGTIAAINGQVASSVFELYLNDTGLIVDEEGNVADTRIALLCGGTFKIYVPTVEAYNEYLPMIDTDTTYQKIEWYIDGSPVANSAADLNAALNDPDVDLVYITEDVADQVTVGDIANKTIDVQGNNASLKFTGKLENVVVTGIIDDGDATPAVQLNGATGSITIKNSTITDNSSQPYGAIAGGSADLEIIVENCTIDGARPIYHSGAIKSFKMVNTTIKNTSSWAVLYNNAISGNVEIVDCTFENCIGVFKALNAIGGDFTFTGNKLIDCQLKNDVYVDVKVSGTITVSGNTMTVDGVETDSDVTAAELLGVRAAQ